MEYSFGRKLRELRKSLNLTQEELVLRMNKKYGTSFNKGMVSKWENDREDPRIDSVRYIADFFNISLDELLGLDKKEKKNADNDLPELTEKDEKDIQKQLKKIINGEDVDSAFAAFDGKILDELDEEDRKLLIASWENTLRLTKRIAKQKFTPKKYRK